MWTTCRRLCRDDRGQDVVEYTLLTAFFGHLGSHRGMKYLHWNMRDVNYGFQAIEHRFRVPRFQRGHQLRLARAGKPLRVLISYGEYWFPWYMRRLAERPANLWFVVRTMFG